MTAKKKKVGTNEEAQVDTQKSTTTPVSPGVTLNEFTRAAVEGCISVTSRVELSESAVAGNMCHCAS